MNNLKYCLIAMIFLLGACQEEDPLPKLEINGHWIMDHEGADECRVVVSIADTEVTLLFQDIIAGACLQSYFGVAGTSLTLEIDSRSDFYNEQEVLVAQLDLSAEVIGAEGVVRVWMSDVGLAGLVENINAADDNLQYFVGVEYDFYAVDEGIMDYRP